MFIQKECLIFFFPLVELHLFHEYTPLSQCPHMRTPCSKLTTLNKNKNHNLSIYLTHFHQEFVKTNQESTK